MARILACAALILAIAAMALVDSVRAADFESRATTTISNPVLTGDGGATAPSYEFFLDFPSIPSTIPPNTGTMTFATGSGVGTIEPGTGNGTDITGVGTNTSHVTGSASIIPGVSSVGAAGAEMHDFVEVVNTNGGGLATTPAVLTFDFAYDFLTDVNAAINEEANASYNIHITGIGDEPGESVRIDPDGPGPMGFFSPATQDFEVADFRSVLAGDSGPLAGSGLITVEYTVDTPASSGDGRSQFSIFTRANGAAFAPVPEPATVGIWVLLGMLAAGFAWRKHRRGK